MARLQLLHLPSIVDGDRVEPRFAIVVDDLELVTPAQLQDLNERVEMFAEKIGAVGALVVTAAVLVVNGEPDDPDPAFVDGPGAASDNPPRPAPVRTEAERRAAMTWGGQPGKDPRDG